MKEKRDRILKLVLGAVAGLLVVMYFIYQSTMIFSDSYSTEIALDSTVYNTVSARAYVVRDEQYVISDSAGTLVTMVNDGDKVTQGDTVAVVFSSEQAAQDYLRSRQIKDELERYGELSGQINFQAMDISSINSQIENNVTDLLNIVDSGCLSNLEEKSGAVRDSITTLQISTGTVFDFSGKIAALEAELSQLNGSISSSVSINAEVAGNFSQKTDGFEAVLNSDDMAELTVEQLEAALATGAAAVPPNVSGKLVTGFNWFIACNVNTRPLADYSAGDTVYVNFPSAGIEHLPTKVYSFGGKGAETSLLVLKCSVWVDGCDSLRCEDMEIIADEHEGLKINRGAVRVVDGEQGVYVLMGNIIRFKKIHIDYSTEDFVIASNPDGESGFIKLYDEVILKGVDLFDGKLIT